MFLAVAAAATSCDTMAANASSDEKVATAKAMPELVTLGKGFTSISEPSSSTTVRQLGKAGIINEAMKVRIKAASLVNTGSACQTHVRGEVGSMAKGKLAK